MNATKPNPETGRITLRLTTNLIRDLRLLAVLLGTNQNALAEDLILKGGLQSTVDKQLNRLPASDPSETEVAPECDLETQLTPLPPPPAMGAMPEADRPRLSILPILGIAPGANDDDVPW